jgi:hypothetical protein
MIPEGTLLLILGVYLGLFLFGAFVLYMFYARLRDISVEIRKFRIAYEFSDSRENQARMAAAPRSAPASAANPFSQTGDSKYQPKDS